MACKELGWHEIKVRVLIGSPTELDLLKLAILDNRSHRQLSVVEQAHGIQKLSPHVPRRNRLQILSSLLGFPQNQGGFGDALYIYSFEIMILVRVKAKSLLCYWAVRDPGIGMAQIARRLNRNSERIPRRFCLTAVLRGLRG